METTTVYDEKNKTYKNRGENATRMRTAGILLIFIVLILSWVVTNKNLPWEVRDGLYLSGCQTCPMRIVSCSLPMQI